MNQKNIEKGTFVTLILKGIRHIDIISHNRATRGQFL